MTSRSKSIYRVYVIEFETGHTYVGMTKFPVAKRLESHKKRHINSAMGEFFKNGAKHIIKEVFRSENKSECYNMEMQVLRAQEKPLNVFGSRFKPQGRNYQRTSKPARCNLCKLEKPALAFWSDRSRSSGLDGRCKQCRHRLAKARNRATWNYVSEQHIKDRYKVEVNRIRCEAIARLEREGYAE